MVYGKLYAGNKTMAERLSGEYLLLTRREIDTTRESFFFTFVSLMLFYYLTSSSVGGA